MTYNIKDKSFNKEKFKVLLKYVNVLYLSSKLKNYYIRTSLYKNAAILKDAGFIPASLHSRLLNSLNIKQDSKYAHQKIDFSMQVLDSLHRDRFRVYFPGCQPDFFHFP